MLLPALRPKVNVMREMSYDWLKDIGGWDSIAVFFKPLVECLNAFWVFGEFGQKSVKEFLWNEARKSSVAIPVPQQSLQSQETGK